MNLSPPSLRKLEGYEDFSSVESRNRVRKRGCEYSIWYKEPTSNIGFSRKDVPGAPDR